MGLDDDDAFQNYGRDVLFPVRNNFYLGAFQRAINESHGLPLKEWEALERDCLVYRSYIALGQCQLVTGEIEDVVPTSLQAVKILALYMSGAKEEALSRLAEWLADSAVASNQMLLVVAGTIYIQEQNYNEALRHTHVGGDLELCALNVQIYLKMQRLEYAEKQLRAMHEIDQDHTLTQLANAWVNLSLGGAKVQEAYYIFEELGGNYTSTVMLINGIAVCQMQMGQFDKAETRLAEALNRDPRDATTLANLVVCSLQLGKPTTRYMSQLKTYFPKHSLVERSAAAESNFDRAAQALA